MCCCEKPTIDGQFGYKWQPGDKPFTLETNPPKMREDDVLICDEPGRCGGMDCHGHPYRLVLNGRRTELLANGTNGVERIYLTTTKEFIAMLGLLSSDQRYWLFHALYYAHQHAQRDAAQQEGKKWALAAFEKRLKTRKIRGTNGFKAWIEEPKA